MATTLKVLGQLYPTLATLSTLYTVPALTTTVVSSLTVCNKSGSSDTFRIAIRPAGGAISDEMYLYYDVQITGNNTFIATVGISLATTDVISVYSTNGTCAFHAYGQENT